MSENYIRIEGPDENGIYGKLRTNDNNNLVIHIHGMTHTMDHMLEVISADFFVAHGYDHYRVSLCPREPDSRNLTQSTLSTHVRDIEAVSKHFQEQYENIFITAHSLGALITLVLNPTNVKAISLWDPAFDIAYFWSTGPYLEHMPEYKQYQLDYGNVYVVSEDFVEEIKYYPDEKCLELAEKVITPTQMIIPEQTIFNVSAHTSPENYKKAFQGSFDIKYIAGANHAFSNEGNQELLLKTTNSWFLDYTGACNSDIETSA